MTYSILISEKGKEMFEPSVLLTLKSNFSPVLTPKTPRNVRVSLLSMEYIKAITNRRLENAVYKKL